MTKEELERMDDQGINAWNEHDIDGFLGMLAEDFVWRDTSLPEPLTSLETMREYMAGWFDAFPDMQMTRTNRVVGEDTLAAEMEFSGTNTGPLTMGGVEIPATGKQVKGQGAYFVRTRDGKVTEFHSHPDSAGMLMQLGLLSGESTSPSAST